MKLSETSGIYNKTVIDVEENKLRRVGSNTTLNTVVTVQHSVNLSECESARSSIKESKLIHSNYISTTINSSSIRNYYVPKCICLISVYPFFVESAKILNTIHKFSRTKRLKKPIERIIENLIIEVPVPPRGLYKVEYHLLNEKNLLTQSPMNQLPFLSIEFEKIFIHFKIEQILEIYKHVLLETRIVFFSSDLSNLTPIIQGFLSLIYPFKYPFQFITILPEENFNFLESVSPYIIGINLKYNFNFFTQNDIDIESMTILIVDIDNRRLDLSSPNLIKIHDYNQKRKYMCEEFPDLPKHYKSKLSNKILEYVKQIKAEKSVNKYIFNQNIRNLFFQFLVNILQNYSKYLNTDYYTQNEISSPNINNLFKTEDFISSHDYGDRQFFRKFINETQIFVEFILKRMIPKDSNEKLEILYFDENLMEKTGRKFFSKKPYTPFIHSTLYDVKHTYSVPKHRGFSEEEVAYFLTSFDNRREALKSGQEILVDGDQLLINYLVFPCLLTDIFFKNSPKAYFLPPNLSEDLDGINIDMVSKSHLGTVSVHRCEMENYINLCWIQLWAMTFWYHDELEKRFRFQQLLNILDCVINHEMEIFNLLFESISKYGEDYMVLKLYERLVYYRLNPSYSICTTVMKLVDKKQILNKNGVGSIAKYVERYDFKKKYETEKFKKRSIKTKFDLNILNSDVLFYTWDTCIECQNNINLEKLSREFETMKRDIFWAECSNCNTGLLPKIAVRFGKELNMDENMKFHTSSFEGFVLYSPYHLKYNLTNGLLKEYGLKLDVDSFKYKFNAIFWDSIWYFKIKNLPFDFILPYENLINFDDDKSINCDFKIKKITKFVKTNKSPNTEPTKLLNELEAVEDNSNIKSSSFYFRKSKSKNKMNQKIKFYLSSLFCKNEIQETINQAPYYFKSFQNSPSHDKNDLKLENIICREQELYLKGQYKFPEIKIINVDKDELEFSSKTEKQIINPNNSMNFEIFYNSETTNFNNLIIQTDQSLCENHSPENREKEDILIKTLTQPLNTEKNKSRNSNIIKKEVTWKENLSEKKGLDNLESLKKEDQTEGFTNVKELVRKFSKFQPLFASDNGYRKTKQTKSLSPSKRLSHLEETNCENPDEENQTQFLDTDKTPV